jgi:hypothetical protein
LYDVKHPAPLVIECEFVVVNFGHWICGVSSRFHASSRFISIEHDLSFPTMARGLGAEITGSESCMPKGIDQAVQFIPQVKSAKSLLIMRKLLIENLDSENTKADSREFW